MRIKVGSKIFELVKKNRGLKLSRVVITGLVASTVIRAAIGAISRTKADSNYGDVSTTAIISEVDDYTSFDEVIPMEDLVKLDLITKEIELSDRLAEIDDVNVESVTDEELEKYGTMSIDDLETIVATAEDVSKKGVAERTRKDLNDLSTANELEAYINIYIGL